ncbi:MAG: glycosyltransferase family 1 protein [Anaerolineae bacterium]
MDVPPPPEGDSAVGPRITIDYTPAARQGAGIGRYTRELIRALARLDTATAYTLLVRGAATVPDSLAGFPPNFRVRRSPLSERTLTRLWRLRVPLPADWLAGPSDVYYSPDYILPPLRRGRAVVTVHDLSFLTVPQAADAGLRAYLADAVPRSVARADHILADSEHTKQDLVRLLRTPADKISVLYSGVSPAFRRVVDEARLSEVRARYGLTGPFILGLGTIEPRKNLVRLIEAFAQLAAAGEPHALALVGGQGWLYGPIFDRVKALGLEERVRFLGFVADADLPPLYSAAEAFAFPSLYEGFGLPPLEALACGTPTVVSNVSSLPEVVGDAALQAPPTDVAALAATLARLLHDEPLRARLREAGPRQASRFTWEAAAAQLRETLYGLSESGRA